MHGATLMVEESVSEANRSRRPGDVRDCGGSYILIGIADVAWKNPSYQLLNYYLGLDTR
jgi:hypothetical protein